MTSVTTQQQAAQQRRLVGFCYLCGNEILPHDITTREHVVPRAICGDGSAQDSWPLILDVHETCERTMKRGPDGVFKLWQNIFLSPEERLDRALNIWDDINSIDVNTGEDSQIMSPATGARLAAAAAGLAAESAAPEIDSQRIYDMLTQFVRVLVETEQITSREESRAQQYLAAALVPALSLEKGHYRNTTLKIVRDLNTDGSFLPLDGFKEIQDTVWTWIRGLHTVLYGTFLPADSSHLGFASIPAFSGVENPQPFPDRRTFALVQACLEAGELADKVDRIRWWNDRCKYRCVWVNSEEKPNRSRCAWHLEIPGPEGTGRWQGWYDAAAIPIPVKPLTDYDLSHFNKHYGLS